MSQKIPDQDLLDELVRLKDELGRTPSIADIREYGEYSDSPYYRRFGGWDKAKELAGLEPHVGPASKSDLLKELKRVADIVGHSPSQADMQEHGRWGITTYRRRFGTWTEAKSRVGLGEAPTDYGGVAIPSANLLADLKRIAENLDRAPTHDEYERWGEYSASPFKRRWGSWNDALREAGLPINNHGHISDSDLLDDIQRVADELGRTPTRREYDQHGRYSSNTHQERFGGWNAAKLEAGLPPSPTGSKSKYEHLTPEDLGMESWSDD